MKGSIAVKFGLGASVAGVEARQSSGMMTQIHRAHAVSRPIIASHSRRIVCERPIEGHRERGTTLHRRRRRGVAIDDGRSGGGKAGTGSEVNARLGQVGIGGGAEHWS